MKRAIIVTFYLSVLFAQSITIEGIVKDKKTQKSLIGANVFIVGTSIGTSTDGYGKYKLSNVNLGSYTLKASYIGYQEVEIDMDLTSAENITQDFELSYVSLQGEAIEVTAQARGQIDAINEQIKAKSIKNIVSSDRIQELPDANAAETVARIPGVSIRREGGEGNKVIIRGLSPKYNKVMVDGTNLASTDPDNRSTDLSMISQYMLEGIEVTKAGTPDQEGHVIGPYRDGVTEVGLCQISNADGLRITQMNRCAVDGWIPGADLDRFDRICCRHRPHAHHHLAAERAGALAVDMGAIHRDVDPFTDVSDLDARGD